MAIRLFQEIADSIRNYILARIPGIAVRPNDQHSELFINPVAAELDSLNLEILNTRSKQNAGNLIGKELDLYGANYGLFRLSATYASGVVILGTTTLPRQQITIPAGSRVYGGDTGSVAYYTLVDVIIPAQTQFELTPTESPYYIQTELQVPVYGARVPIQAVNLGTGSNLDIGTVRARGPGIPTAINYINNEQAVSGGFNEQTDLEFLDSINRFFLSNIPQNEEAIIRSVLEVAGNVYDIKVIGIGHPLMVRDNGVGGKIDVVIVGSKNVFVTETFTNVTNLNNLPLKFYPVSSILSITGSNTGLYPQSAYYLDRPEFPNPIAGTSKAKTEIVLTGTTIPNETITISYTFNKTIYDAANYLSKYSVSPGTDILVKLGTPTLVDVSATIKLNQTATDRENIRSRAQTALRLFLNSFSLGQQITVTQIVEVLKAIDSAIIDVRLPLTNFATNGGSSVTEIFIQDDEYVRAGTIGVFIE